MDYLARGLKPGVSYSVQVRSQEDGNFSPWSPTFTFTAPLPPAPTQTPTVTLTAQSLGYIVNISGQDTVYDYGGTRIYASTSSGFAPGVGNLVATTTDTIQIVNNATFVPIYVKVSFIDAWGQEGPFSVQQSVTPINPVVVDTTAPAAPGGLAATSTANEFDISGQTYTMTFTWTAVGDADLSGYYVRYGAYTANNTVAPTQYFTSTAKTNSFIVQNAQAGQKYDWSVAAFDKQNNTSAFTSGTAHTIPVNTTAPAAPSGVNYSVKDGIIYVSWPAPATTAIFDPKKGIGLYRVKVSTLYTTATADATWTGAVEDGSTNFSYDSQSPSLAIPLISYGVNHYVAIYSISSVGTVSTVTKLGPILPSSPDLGSNLVMNGNLGYGSNYNYSRLSAGTFVGSDKPGGGGCLTFSPYTSVSVTNDDLIPIDPIKTYTMSTSVKELTAPMSITSASITSNVATVNFTPTPTSAAVSGTVADGVYLTVTTSSDHGFVIGQLVTTTGSSNGAYNAPSMRIIDVPTSTTFKVVLSANAGSGTGGTATVPAIAYTAGNGILIAGTGNANFDGQRTVVAGGSSSITFNVTAANQAIGAVGTIQPQSTTYIGAALYDIDGNVITSQAYMYQANTLTTLAATLNPGATTITLTSGSNWNNAAGVLDYLRSMIIWNYKDSKGYTYPPGTYSRNIYAPVGGLWADGGISGNVITLSSPWSGPSIPAGTSVSNGAAGGTYKYFVSIAATPAVWTKYSADIGGVDYTGTNIANMFPPGTAYMKTLFLAQYNQTTSASRTGFGSISITQKSDGVVPKTSPACSAGASFQGINVQWAAISNPDPVTYEVHISESSGFTPTSGTKVGETDGSYFFIKTQPGTTVALKNANTTGFSGYYVKIWARDADGYASDAGTQSSLVIPTALEGPDLISSFFLADRQIKVGNNAIQNIWLKAPPTVANFTKTTSASTASGFTLPVANTTDIAIGQLITGTNIPYPTYVASLITNTSVTLDRAITGTVGSGATLTFKNVARLWAGPDTPGWNTASTGFFLDGVGNLSLADKFSWDGTTLNVIGDITATSGEFIGNMSVGAGGTMKFGVGVSGTNSGLYIAPNNYWYNDGSFSIGNPNGIGQRLNIYTNPNLESNTITGHGGANSATISTSTTQKYQGTYSMLVTCGATVAQQGGYAIFTNLAANTYYTVSGYLYNPTTNGIASGVFLTVQGAGVAGPSDSAVTNIRDSWVRVSTTFQTNATPASGVIPYFISAGNPTAGTIFYIDAMLLELGTSLNPYFDGNTFGAAWTGTANLSTSSAIGGAIDWDGITFFVDGNITARSGTFNGNVEIQNGGSLFAKGGAAVPGTPGTLTGQRVVLNYQGVQGISSASIPQFTLSATGPSHIGPWFFDHNRLTGGSGGSEVGLAVSGPASFWAGGTSGAAPFRVSPTGLMNASAAIISGNVTASSGTIAGISIINAFPALPNGNFESAIDTGTDNWNSFWKGAGATATRAAGEGVGGSYAYKVVVPASSGSTLEWTGTIPVVPGETYTLTAQVKASSVLTNSIIVGLLSGPTAFHTKFFDSQANWSATEYAIANSTTSFSTFTKAYTVPAGVYFIRPVVQMGMEGTASIRTFWVDDVTLTRSGSFNALVAGTGLPGSDTMKFMVADSGIISTTSKMAAIPGKFAMSGEINATSIEGASMRAVEYKTLGVTAVAANQTTYSVLPDAGTGAGTTFVAPISGCVLVLVSAILQSQDAATVVSYEIRTGGTLGSGSVVVAAATENGAYASGGAGGVELMNTSGFQSNYVSGLTPNATYNIRFMNYNADTVARNIQYRKLTIIPQL